VRESLTAIIEPPGKNRDDVAAAALRGDPASFERLVRTHQSYAFSLAMKFLCDEAEADDVVQEAFLRIWKNISRYNPDQKFTTWLYKIVANLCIDRIRSLQRDRRLFERGNQDTELQNVADGHSWETLRSHEQLAEIVGVLSGRLSEKQRIVFTLRDLHDLGVDEVAKITGLSVGSVKTNLHYARKFIRNILVRKYGVTRNDL
jgi:RNA polymerase sigma-70 factor (ECF subfamily)